jgi:Peroxisomal biogenesis factor 11 (PEX11)
MFSLKNKEVFFRVSQRFWLFGLICKIIKNIRKIKKSVFYRDQLKSRMLHYDPDEYDGIRANLEAKRIKAIKFLFRDLCDFVIASKNSSFLSLFGV